MHKLARSASPNGQRPLVIYSVTRRYQLFLLSVTFYLLGVSNRIDYILHDKEKKLVFGLLSFRDNSQQLQNVKLLCTTLICSFVLFFLKKTVSVNANVFVVVHSRSVDILPITATFANNLYNLFHKHL